MTTQQQKIKGRARIYLDKQYVPKDIEPPRYGATGYGAMEIEEYLDKFKDHLQLPEKYNIIGVFFDVPYYSWCIVVESDDIPLPPRDEIIPMMSVCYEYIGDGKSRIVDLMLI